MTDTRRRYPANPDTVVNPVTAETLLPDLKALAARLPAHLSREQTLALIAWETEAAVRYFASGDAARAWAKFRKGKYPEALGRPKLTAAQAEASLRQGIAFGFLNPDEPPR